MLLWFLQLGGSVLWYSYVCVCVGGHAESCVHRVVRQTIGVMMYTASARYNLIFFLFLIAIQYIYVCVGGGGLDWYSFKKCVFCVLIVRGRIYSYCW